MVYQRVSFTDIDLYGDFWEKRQDINRETTIYSVRDRFEETGRFRAFDMIPPEQGGVKPHYFWDSDVAKWIESVAYIIEKHPDPELEQKVESLIDKIEAHQGEDGYFNIYFTVVEPQNRFKNRDAHELYCAGHLIEAAVAWAQATGREKFLDLMKKYVDYIIQVFVIEKSAAFSTPGHEEIELALYKLFQYTGERRYLDLAIHFINTRGTIESERDLYNQSHCPVREQKTAEGHSVRACYLYTAMADLAAETGDAELRKACETLFDNIYWKRCYITGGIGSSYQGEAFTIDYDLPNAEAYAETCAAISLAFFAGRMQRISPNPAYADIIERVMYNGMLSGVSLNGKEFFYENPLEIDHARRHRNVSVHDSEHYAPARRQEVFSCSCCPPNITRFIASIADYQYTYDQDTVYVHQYMSGVANFDLYGTSVKISQKTNYPISGDVDIVVKNMKGKTLAVRIPFWSKNFTLYLDGGKSDKEIKDGYVYINVKSDMMSLTLRFDMNPRVMYSDPHNTSDAARVSLCRGPLVYCMESCDNAQPLRSLRLLLPLEIEEFYNQELDCIQISARSLISEAPQGNSSLYYSDSVTRSVTSEWIPYYAFANREECDMLVWCSYNEQ